MPDELIRAMERILKHQDPPTALVAIRPRQVATALSWLGACRIRVPRDLSLISLGYDPFLKHFYPEISGYRTDPKAVANRLIRRLEHLNSSSRRDQSGSWIEPQVVTGDSLAKR